MNGYFLLIFLFSFSFGVPIAHWFYNNYIMNCLLYDTNLDEDENYYKKDEERAEKREKSAKNNTARTR